MPGHDAVAPRQQLGELRCQLWKAEEDLIRLGDAHFVCRQRLQKLAHDSDADVCTAAPPSTGVVAAVTQVLWQP